MGEEKRTTETKTCKECNEEFSAYGLSAHIKYSHEINVEEYVKKHGEFRKSKLNESKKQKRKTQQIKCKECGNKYSSVGMHTHLSQTHNMSVEEYVEKHGEYRKKQKERERRKKKSKYECQICNEKLVSDRQLSFHVRKEHDLSKEDYVLEYIFGGEHPTCECGCGDKVEILSYEPYKRKYISGHNSKGENNPMFGKKFSNETREKMRRRAKERIRNYNGRLPMHNRFAILQNTYGIWENYLEFLEEKKNIRCLSERNILDGNQKLQFECEVCGNIWKSFSLGTDCKKCKKDKSKEEKTLYNFIKNELEFEDAIRNNRSILPDERELDIVVPSKNIAVEYDGLYWHGEWGSGKHKKYHLEKTELAKENGYHLIHVFSDEWKNNKDLVKSRISYILGKSTEKTVYARNCHVENISTNEARSFIDNNHLQGYTSSRFKLGLFDSSNDDLVAVITFSIPRAGIGSNQKSDKNSFELNRYCTKNGIIPVGGMGKLFKHFVRNNNPSKVITFADRRWSSKQKNIYEKIGFELDEVTDPNYWYTLNYNKRKHRFNFTKKRIVKEYGGDPNLTELENMKKMGYDRIWDCGHLKYIWKKDN